MSVTVVVPLVAVVVSPVEMLEAVMVVVAVVVVAEAAVALMVVAVRVVAVMDVSRRCEARRLISKQEVLQFHCRCLRYCYCHRRCCRCC